MTKLPVIINNKEMPIDKNICCKYQYKGRTSGGFVDAVFLSSIILTGGIWIMILIILGGK